MSYKITFHETYKANDEGYNNFWTKIESSDLMLIPEPKYPNHDMYVLRFRDLVNVPNEATIEIEVNGSKKRFKKTYQSVPATEQIVEGFHFIDFTEKDRRIDLTSLKDVVWWQLGDKDNDELYLIKLGKYSPSPDIYLSYRTKMYYCYCVTGVFVLKRRSSTPR